MFGLFKNKVGSLNATQDGRLLTMEEVPDEMFSEKMLGDGFAILPSSENVYSPVNGEITSVYEGSNHCYGISTDDGLELLIHIGIDTVSLRDQDHAILPKVTLGQKIKIGDLIACMDIYKVRSKNLNLHTMNIITNMEKIKSFTLINKKEVRHGDEVFRYELA